MTQRTDTHRPSVINPEDYNFVALGYQKCEGLEDVYSISVNRERLEAHMQSTGGKYSNHEHGGNCHICGAHCLYTAVFHHPETNVYIRTGLDCAENMHMGDIDLFRKFRASIQDALKRKAGKAKSKAILEEAGLIDAWIYYDSEEHYTEFEESTIVDIVSKLVKYGSISDRQMTFVKSLLGRIEKRAEIEALRQQEHEQAENCPKGRVTIVGSVISKKVQDTRYGPTLKMLVKDDRGFKVWGTVPSHLQLFDIDGEQRGLERDDRVQFIANVEPSSDDPKFGFYKRPHNAALIT